MFVVRTTLAPSAIHGLGVFASEAIAAGQEVWRFRPGIDLVLLPDDLADVPAAFRTFLDHYAYPSAEFAPGSLVLLCDNAKYLNHSDDANCESVGPVNRALRPIAPGEEITCDYRACVSGWSGF